jgi:hypothetical protein
MWNINYEDKDKFHMSIGIGLIVGSFILFVSNTWFFYEKVDIIYSDLMSLDSKGNFSEEIKGMIDKKSEFLLTMSEYFNLATSVFLIVGLSSFLFGYIPWIKKQYVNKSRTSVTKK